MNSASPSVFSINGMWSIELDRRDAIVNPIQNFFLVYGTPHRIGLKLNFTSAARRARLAHGLMLA